MSRMQWLLRLLWLFNRLSLPPFQFDAKVVEMCTKLLVAKEHLVQGPLWYKALQKFFWVNYQSSSEPSSSESPMFSLR